MQYIWRNADIPADCPASIAAAIEDALSTAEEVYPDFLSEKYGFIAIAGSDDEEALMKISWEAVEERLSLYVVYSVVSNDGCNVYFIPKAISWSEEFLRFIKANV